MAKKGNPNFKKAPVGSSHKIKDPAPEGVKGMGAMHRAGKTVPSFNAERHDNLNEVKVPSVPHR